MSQLSPAGAPATPEDAPVGEVAPSEAPKISAGDIECRMSERFSVEGDAEVAASDGSAVFRGRILNISATGCYVQSVAYTRLAPGTPVELVFRINSIENDSKQCHIHAEARFSKPRIGIGFRFLRMTPELQTTLDTIISALEAAKNSKP